MRICQQNEQAIATLSVFDRMKSNGIKPDRYAYQVCISSCLHIEKSAWIKAIELLRECDLVLPLGGNNGTIQANISMSIFSTAINICEKSGKSRLAINLYDEMHSRKNLPPTDVVTISSVVAACEQGDFDYCCC